MRLGPLIDTHQHPVPDVYKRALAKVGIHGSGENPWPSWSLQSQLDLMDQFNIAAAINSIASPGAYFGDVDEAIRIARECNEAVAAMIAEHPRRLGAFALLPLPDVAAAIREVEYALDVLGLEGICLLSHAGSAILATLTRTSFMPSSTAARPWCSCIRCATAPPTCRIIPIPPA